MGGTGTAAAVGRSVAGSVPGLDALWAETTGDPRVRVAVLDGPVDLGHPCFSGTDLKAAPTLATGGAAGGPAPSEHGTHVASILFGRHDGPVPGVAPGCAGWILPVFSATPDGGVEPCSQRDLARAIHEAVRLGASVINISGGELQEPSEADPYLQRAVEDAARNGSLIVSAVGNQGCECAQVPAALPSVLAVGGLDREGRPLRVSNWGEPLSRQGILAPAAEILGATPGGGTAARTGTSFATPIVSGAASLLMSLQLAAGRKPDAAAVRAALIEGASPCPAENALECARFLAGRLDLPAARALLGLDRRSVAVAGVAAAAAAAALPAPAPAARVPVLSRPEEAGEPASGAAGIATRIPEQPRPTRGGERVMNEHPAGGHDQSAPETVAASEAAARPASPPAADAAGQSPAAGAGGHPSGALQQNCGGEVRAACACEGGGGAGGGSVRSARLAPPGTGAAPGARPGQVVALQSNIPEDYPLAQQPLAFAIGKLSYDFGTEARRDYFVSQIDPEQPFKVYDPTVMAGYLGHVGPTGTRYNEALYRAREDKASHPEDANGLIWTLVIDQDPVYAILPQDQYATISYFLLVNFLWDQAHEDVDRVAAAGTITGSVRLLNGAVVPTIAPVTRGLFDWNIKALYDALKGQGQGNEGAKDKKAKGKEPAAGNGEECTEPEFRSFLVRVYDLLRNLGVSSSDRALNFAATNAFQVYHIFRDACRKGLRLDKFSTRRSPICRRDSDCWDVALLFFNPTKLIEQARRVYEFTIDVSDVVPVQVGALRQYDVYTDPFGG